MRSTGKMGDREWRKRDKRDKFLILRRMRVRNWKVLKYRFY